MKFFLALFLLVYFHFSSFTMEKPPAESGGNSNQDVAGLHLYSFSANDEFLNKPQVWFSYRQENLFEACEISDKIREMIRCSKPLLVALKLTKKNLLDEKKEECIKLALTLNKASNLLAARTMDCKSEYLQTAAYKRLSQYVTRLFEFLGNTNRPDGQYTFERTLIDEDHPISELQDACDSIRDCLKNQIHEDRKNSFRW